ncbi:hypothetical protein H2199_000384 [Coniosporium tulheliwenetii]|uniref:Uncharacterized protein n=1 Tax=Coniosporium tulheliwenetii TaxID=3383036 RepID=A0ACC2ZPV4_9PEZI|nr:hypothetical protein H2199_000384 [Cladosporium sp. JES 115]
MLMSCLKKANLPRWLRWLWVLFDVAFVGASIAVATLTRPNGGPSGPRHCYSNRDVDNESKVTGNIADARDDTYNLPWGTLILSIISTILHALTAAFYEVRDRHRERHSLDKEARLKHEHEIGAK